MNLRKKQKILIVEDEGDIQEIYKTKLEREGYETVTADSGTEGIALAEKEKPDLILLDIILPMKEGFSVLADLKKNPETRGIPVIILSNLDQDYEIKMARDLGAEGYLTKSNVTPEEVAEKVRGILGKNKE